MYLKLNKRDGFFAADLLLVTVTVIAALTGLWALALFSAGLFVVTLTVRVSKLVRLGLASRSWPSVPAIEVDARVFDKPKSRTYQLRVNYSYSVHGTEHEATRYRYPFGVMLSVSTMQQRVRELNAAAQLPVYYDPSEPSTSTLQTGISVLDGMVLVIFYGVAVPAIVALFIAGVATL
jgi:hypothetical protein